jgi:chemotaxis signal transduction protein
LPSASMTSVAARNDTLVELAAPDDFDSSAEASSTRHARVLLFSLAGHLHCAGLGSIREVVPLKPMTPLPGSPAHVCGLINLRGTIVTVLDATMSEYGVPSSSHTASILLVELGTRVAGVVVDQVHDIGLLEKDVPFEALLDLGALVQMALV